MKLSYEKTEAGDYSVKLNEEGRKVQDMGELSNTCPGRWQFLPGSDIRLSDDVEALEFAADDFAGACKFIETHLGVVKADGGRLHNQLMHDHINLMLQGANVLACRTKSLPGYISGICEALGRLIVEDIKPERREKVHADLATEVRKFADYYQKKADRKESMAAMLGDFLGDLLNKRGNDDDDDEESAPDAKRH